MPDDTGFNAIRKGLLEFVVLKIIGSHSVYVPEVDTLNVCSIHSPLAA